jgi:hypothetical protein
MTKPREAGPAQPGDDRAVPREKKRVTKLRFYLAGAGAGIFVAFADFAKDQQTGTVARLGSALHNLSPAFGTWINQNSLAIILVALISVFVCWIYEVKSQLDGFLRGCSVLLAFNLGTPNPIINHQPDPTGQAMIEQTQNFGWAAMVTPAFAQSTEKSEAILQAYVVLEHLLPSKDNPPQSTVTISRKSGERVALFTIQSFLFSLSVPAGEYSVQVDTPDFRSIAFDVTIDTAGLAYSVTAPTSKLPPVFQGLIGSEQVKTSPPNAEDYKQIGRAQLLSQNYAGAIASYQNSLKLVPDDPQTQNFLGYALYRAGDTKGAQAALELALQLKPDYQTAHVNLAKVYCTTNNLDAARATLSGIDIQPLMSSDGEFQRVCAGI